MAATGKSVVTMLKNAVVSQAKNKQTATVVFLHGLGDTGHGWCHLLSEMQPSHVKLICPTAPIVPVTLNHGMKMPAWFDVYSIAGSGRQDEDGIKEAVKRVHELLDQESAEVPSNRIILGGFSQGGSLAMLAGLMYSKPLAGILALSTWLPLHNRVTELMLPENKEIPFLQCHGEADQVVPHAAGEKTSKFIKTFNNSHKFKSYPGLGHSSDPQEMKDLMQWMTEVLPPQQTANM